MANQSNVVHGVTQTWFGTLADYQAANTQRIPVKAGTIIVDASTTPNNVLGISDGAGGFNDIGRLTAAQAAALTVPRKIGELQQQKIGYVTNGNGNKQGCFFGKETAPAEFFAVRMTLRQPFTTGIAPAGITLYRAVIAATETANTDDASTDGLATFNPYVGGSATGATYTKGTKYNVLDSATDAYGWRSVTWGGPGIYSPSGSLVVVSTNLAIARSDWCYVKSVPRVDTGETLPLFMYRIGYNNVGATTPFFTLDAGTSTQGRTAANMGRILQAYQVTDAAGTYSNTPTTNPSAGFNQIVAYVGWEFMTLAAASGGWFIGDSTIHGSVIPADHFSGWPLQACAILQDTYGKIVGSVNYGAASMLAATYWDGLSKVGLAVAKPTFAVYQVQGHNDYGSPSATTALLARVSIQRCMGKAFDFIATCRENGIIPVLCTSFSSSAITTAAADAERLALNVQIKSMGVPVIDMAALLDDTNVSPQRILTAYNNGDNIHPNIAGIAAQGVLAASVLNTII